MNHYRSKSAKRCFAVIYDGRVFGQRWFHKPIGTVNKRQASYTANKKKGESWPSAGAYCQLVKGRLLILWSFRDIRAESGKCGVISSKGVTGKRKYVERYGFIFGTSTNRITVKRSHLFRLYLFERIVQRRERDRYRYLCPVLMTRFNASLRCALKCRARVSIRVFFVFSRVSCSLLF